MGERDWVQFQKQQGEVGIYNQGAEWELGRVRDEEPSKIARVGDLAGFLLKLHSAEVKPVPKRQDLAEKRAQGSPS